MMVPASAYLQDTVAVEHRLHILANKHILRYPCSYALAHEHLLTYFTPTRRLLTDSR